MHSVVSESPPLQSACCTYIEAAVTTRTERRGCSYARPNVADSVAFRDSSTCRVPHRAPAFAAPDRSRKGRRRRSFCRLAHLGAAVARSKKSFPVNEKNFRGGQKARAAAFRANASAHAGRDGAARRKTVRAACKCDRRHAFRDGPNVVAPSSATVSRIACSAAPISRTPRRPMQPTRKLGATVSLPG